MAGLSASILFALAPPCEAQTQGLKVVFSDEVEKALSDAKQNPERTRRRLERNLNDGLGEMAKNNADAKALLESGQTIRIVCFGEAEATNAELTQDVSPLTGAESGETRGDFGEDGKPKKGGTALIAIDCDALRRASGFDQPAAGDGSTMFQVLIHEILHAANRDRKHPPDELDLYVKFVRDFEQSLLRARGVQVPEAPADSAPAAEPPGHGSATPPAVPGGLLASMEERWGVGIGLGYQMQQAPSVDFGTLVTGAPGSEEAAVESEENISGVLARLRMQTPWGEVDFEYFDGEETESASEPVGGSSIGFVYFQPASSGSLGLDTGPSGGEFRIRSELNQYAVGYRLPFTLHESEREGRVVSSWAAGPVLAFTRSETDYEGEAFNTSIPGIFTMTDQKVDENRYGIGALGRYRRALAPSIVGTVVIDVDLYYRDSDLKSRQQNVCGAPGCPAANTFTADNRDSDAAFTWGTGIKLELDYSPCEDSLLGIDLGYRYLGATAALKNPTSTIDFDPPPNLGDDDVHGVSVGFRFQYLF